MESTDGTPPAPQPPSPPGPTTAAPPKDGCGSPQWATDEFCDDENNNAECAWDGGACCNNDATGWDNYCNDCACLDPAATTPAPPPKDGCGSPQWAKDEFCDDENNNAGCAWDGGACCGNTMSGWDNYCNDCACLDPAGPACEDNWKTKKCQKKKNKGKCGKPKVAANCQLTCGLC